MPPLAICLICMCEKCIFWTPSCAVVLNSLGPEWKVLVFFKFHYISGFVILNTWVCLILVWIQLLVSLTFMWTPFERNTELKHFTVFISHTLKSGVCDNSHLCSLLRFKRTSKPVSCVWRGLHLLKGGTIICHLDAVLSLMMWSDSHISQALSLGLTGCILA